MAWKLTVDADACLRAGQCHHLAPQLVGWRDDDYPEIIASNVADADREAAQEITEMCPSGALTFEAG